MKTKLGSGRLFGLLFVSALTNGASSQAAGALRDLVPLEPLATTGKAVADVVIEDVGGQAVDPTAVATLSLSAAAQAERVKSAAALAASLKGRGFAVAGRIGPVEDLTISAGGYADTVNALQAKIAGKGQDIRAEYITVHEKQAIDKPALVNQAETAAEVYVPAANPGIRVPVGDAGVKAANAAAAGQTGLDQKALYLQSQAAKCDPKAADSQGVKCFADSVKDPAVDELTPLSTGDRTRCDADTPLGKKVLVDQPWTDAGGDKSFGWSGDANFRLSADAAGLTLKANAAIEGKALGFSRTMIEAKAGFVSPRSGRTSGNFRVAFLEKALFDAPLTWDQSLVSSRNSDGDEAYMFEQDDPIYSTTFMVGFVPVAIKVNSKFKSGPTYQIDLIPVQVNGRAEFVTQATVMATAGVGGDLGIVEAIAGIKGSLALINATIGTYPEAGLKLDERSRPVIAARVDGRATMQTLAGAIELGVWAQTKFPVPQPKGGWPPRIEMKPLKYEWSQTIGNYPGYSLPPVVIFDQIVGYDVCSGAVTREVVVPSQPRQPDQRQDYEALYLAKVKELEAKVKVALDQVVAEGATAAAGAQLNEADNGMATVTANMEQLLTSSAAL